MSEQPVERAVKKEELPFWQVKHITLPPVNHNFEDCERCDEFGHTLKICAFHGIFLQVSRVHDEKTNTTTYSYYRVPRLYLKTQAEKYYEQETGRRVGERTLGSGAGQCRVDDIL
ncbi:hypothetical protein VKT23_012385 [Stygiomarasmius scandens]|uniref:Uncharacterized protein n=1 Tax=Marasmiellus scandens TaxID=2682957 RepID=A0ABR1J713_9AGAR